MQYRCLCYIITDSIVHLLHRCKQTNRITKMQIFKYANIMHFPCLGLSWMQWCGPRGDDTLLRCHCLRHWNMCKVASLCVFAHLNICRVTFAYLQTFADSEIEKFLKIWMSFLMCSVFEHICIFADSCRFEDVLRWMLRLSDVFRILHVRRSVFLILCRCRLASDTDLARVAAAPHHLGIAPNARNLIVNMQIKFQMQIWLPKCFYFHSAPIPESPNQRAMPRCENVEEKMWLWISDVPRDITHGQVRSNMSDLQAVECANMQTCKCVHMQISANVNTLAVKIVRSAIVNTVAVKVWNYLNKLASELPGIVYSVKNCTGAGTERCAYKVQLTDCRPYLNLKTL